MNKKVLISILLLITYSLGFSHNLIPHTHNVESEEHTIAHQKGEHHHHYHQNETRKQGHEYITHGDHYDENIYDLLVCFLHNADEQKEMCSFELYIPSPSNRALANKIEKVKLLAILAALSTEIEQPKIIFSEFTYLKIKSSPSPIENSPLRGPPEV